MTVWTQDGETLASDRRTVVHTAPGVDRDSDGVADGSDNCVRQPNEDQADLDEDGAGDACDSDIDGDGHSNAKERVTGHRPLRRVVVPRSQEGRVPALVGSATDPAPGLWGDLGPGAALRPIPA